ncbi:kinase-like domain [Cordyceps militaris]|uniref:EKC/KEOPS complex subunit BUD32 n=1 Tax=Cordyceps militaris TaxID=73501 RepID=A0A2H4SSQ7_CORMI|nr:kinase-like domain [Cordyceps militaris]
MSTSSRDLPSPGSSGGDSSENLNDSHCFSLIPKNARAEEYVQRVHKGRDVLSFRYDDRARVNACAIVYIGPSIDDDDIVLGSDKEGRCFFTISPAGDLVLCDASKDTRPQLVATPKSALEAAMFRLRWNGDHCALPTTDHLTFYIKFPSGERFAVDWGENLITSRAIRETRQALAEQYVLRKDAVGTGELPFAVKQMYPKEVYNYHCLGYGVSGVVHHKVEIRDGAEYAVKSIRKEFLGKPEYLDLFKKEIALHASLVHHDCEKLFNTENSEHLSAFLGQCLGALDYLDERKVVHGDIRLENILFKQSNQGIEFFLSGFGCATKVQDAKNWSGDARYMPPEQFEHQALPSPKSDIYSFGMTSLEFLGSLCRREYQCGGEKWRTKLRNSGCTVKYNRGDYSSKSKFKHISRVQFLRKNGLLPNEVLEEVLGKSHCPDPETILEKMLNPDPWERPRAKELLEDLKDTLASK